jgi:c-di-GMP-binding flagellar brake protein YcgR
MAENSRGLRMRENRKFIRLNAPIGISYRVTKQKRRKSAQSLIRNIGGGGIRFLAKEALREGDLIQMEINIPHLKDPIEAIGEVIWYSESKDRDRDIREAGVRFCDITPKDLHQVLEYVHTIGIG